MARPSQLKMRIEEKPRVICRDLLLPAGLMEATGLFVVLLDLFVASHTHGLHTEEGQLDTSRYSGEARHLKHL